MANPYQKYQEQAVMTMTQGELLVKLFETCSKRLNAGVYYIEQKDFEQANINLQKAQKILNHLSATLNFDYEISGNLYSLYDYFVRQIVKGNIRKDVEPIKEVIPMIDTLGATFKEADKLVHKQRA